MEFTFKTCIFSGYAMKWVLTENLFVLLWRHDSRKLWRVSAHFWLRIFIIFSNLFFWSLPSSGLWGKWNAQTLCCHYPTSIYVINSKILRIKLFIENAVIYDANLGYACFQGSSRTHGMGLWAIKFIIRIFQIEIHSHIIGWFITWQALTSSENHVSKAAT